MFNTETDLGEPEQRQERRRRAAPQTDPRQPLMARLSDPAWIATTLWRRKGLVLLAALAGTVLAGLASLFIPPKYVSTAQLFIDPRDLRVLQNEVSPNASGGDPTSTTGYLESQARVIASDSIKSRVVESEGLDKDPEFGGEATRTGLMRFLTDLLPRGGEPPRDGLLYALAALDKQVTVRRGERTFVIDIAVTSREATKAARIANGLANAYLEDQTSVRADAAQRATGALTGRLEELRNRLRIAEEKAEKYKEANGIVGVGGKSIGEEQLALNNAQLVALRTKVTEAKAKYDQTRAARASAIEAGAIPEAVASNTMTALRSQLGAALNKEADLLASLGARHPALGAAQAQVRDARRQIADELARIAQAAKVEYDRAVEAEKQIAQRVAQLTASQYAAGRALVELRELEREVESSRVVYDAFLKRARETGELAGIDTTNARIISFAVPPLEKSGLSRRTIALLGGIGGGGVGALLALGLALKAAPGEIPPPATPEPGRRSFRLWSRRERAAGENAATDALEPTPTPAAYSPAAYSPAAAPPADAAPAAQGGALTRRFATIPGGQTDRIPDLLQAAAAPLLATLPAVRHRRWRRSHDGEARSVFQLKSHLVDVLDKPDSGFARAIRALGSALGDKAGGLPRRILVVGLRGQAGCSTVALNLALEAATSGRPALLIDAGMGEASLTRVFAPDATLGLADIASGAAGLVRVARQDEGTGLFFLPRAGRTDEIGADRIAHDVFGAMRRFGPIVVDGGALGGDALPQRFAKAVDDIVLVVREGAVALADLERANAALGEHAAKIRGFVVNAA